MKPRLAPSSSPDLKLNQWNHIIVFWWSLCQLAGWRRRVLHGQTLEEIAPFCLLLEAEWKVVFGGGIIGASSVTPSTAPKGVTRTQIPRNPSDWVKGLTQNEMSRQKQIIIVYWRIYWSIRESTIVRGLHFTFVCSWPQFDMNPTRSDPLAPQHCYSFTHPPPKNVC